MNDVKLKLAVMGLKINQKNGHLGGPTMPACLFMYRPMRVCILNFEVNGSRGATGMS